MYAGIIGKIKEPMARNWDVTLTNTYREGNMSANWLAKKGAMGSECLLYWDTPPLGIGNPLEADAIGMGFCRS